MTGAGAVGVWSAQRRSGWCSSLGLTGGFGHCLACAARSSPRARLAGGTAGRTPARGRPVPTRLPRRAADDLRAASAPCSALLGEAGALAKLGGPAWSRRCSATSELAAGVLMLVVGLAMLGVATARAHRAGRRVGRGGRRRTRWFGRAYAKLAAAGWKASFPLGIADGAAAVRVPPAASRRTRWPQDPPCRGRSRCSPSGSAPCRRSRGSGRRAACSGRGCAGWLAYAGAALVVALGVFAVVRGLVRVGAIRCSPPMPAETCDLCGLPVLGRPVRVSPAEADVAPSAAERDVLLRGLPTRVGDRRAGGHRAALLAGPGTTRARRGRGVRARPRPRRSPAPGGRPCASTACGARRARSCSRTRSWPSRACSTPRSATRPRSRGSPTTRQSPLPRTLALRIALLGYSRRARRATRGPRRPRRHRRTLFLRFFVAAAVGMWVMWPTLFVPWPAFATRGLRGARGHELFTGGLALVVLLFSGWPFLRGAWRRRAWGGRPWTRSWSSARGPRGCTAPWLRSRGAARRTSSPRR